MPRKRISITLCATLVCTLAVSVAQAQGPRPIKEAFRWLGHGHATGYHVCNPGTDPSYYNPYSMHNSLLISQDPMYAQSAIQSTDLLSHRRFHLGIPFSVYAAPANMASPNGMMQYPSVQGVQVESTFEPYEATKEEMEENSEETGDSDDGKQGETTQLVPQRPNQFGINHFPAPENRTRPAQAKAQPQTSPIQLKYN